MVKQGSNGGSPLTPNNLKIFRILVIYIFISEKNVIYYVH